MQILLILINILKTNYLLTYTSKFILNAQIKIHVLVSKLIVINLQPILNE